MSFEPTYNRHSIRLPDFDYANPGGYFVTICVQNREYIFGDVEDGEVILSQRGKVVEQSWQAISEHFPGVIIDNFVVMPNHFHGIIIIVDSRFSGRGEVPSPSGNQEMGGTTPPLPNQTL